MKVAVPTDRTGCPLKARVVSVAANKFKAYERPPVTRLLELGHLVPMWRTHLCVPRRHSCRRRRAKLALAGLRPARPQECGRGTLKACATSAVTLWP